MTRLQGVWLRETKCTYSLSRGAYLFGLLDVRTIIMTMKLGYWDLRGVSAVDFVLLMHDLVRPSR